MPKLFLKSDPTQSRDVSQEEANILYATGEWEFSPDQKIFLSDPNGETFAVDASLAPQFLGGHGAIGPQAGLESTEGVVQRAAHGRDVEEYYNGVGNKFLMGAEAVGRGISLGGTDALFGGKGAAIRREEAGGYATALELVGALAPVVLSAGTAAPATGASVARSLAGRLIANTPAGLVARGGEAVRVATAARVAAVADIGLLGKLGSAMAPAVAQGATEGILYGAGEGVSQLSLGDDPVTAESIFATVGGVALQGGLVGGGLGAGMVAGGRILRGIQSRVTKRLDAALSSAGREELANRIASGADPEIQAFRSKLVGDHELEVLALQEQQALAKIKAETIGVEVEGIRSIGRKSREDATRSAFALQRDNLSKQIALEKEAVEGVSENMRRQIRESYGYKAVKDNPELMALGKEFSESLSDVYGTLGHANRLIRVAADAVGDMGGGGRLSKSWAETYSEFRAKFSPGGKLIKDPETLARLLVDPANRQLLGKVEKSAAETLSKLGGGEVFFDDMLANFKITDEFVNASELAVNAESRSALQQEMFDRQLGLVEKQKKQLQQELMRRGEDGYQDLILREHEAVQKIRADADIARAVDSKEIDDLTRKLEALKGKDIDAALEKEIIEKTDMVSKIASQAGLNLSMSDKIAIAASIGLEFDVIPSGTLLDRVVELATIGKLVHGRGFGALLGSVSDKSGLLGRIANSAMYSVAGSVAGRATGVGGRRMAARASRAATASGLIGIAKGMGSGLSRTLKDSEVTFLRTVDDGVDKFLRAGKFVKPAVIPTAVKILNSTSFGDGGPKPKTMLEAFRARSAELTAAVGNPGAIQAKLDDSLGLLNFGEPILSGRLQAMALKRMQFLYDKMPKDPGMGVFGQPTFWRPSDSEIAKWARYIDGADNPAKVVSDMASGRLSFEQSEAFEAIYPDLYARVQMRIFDTVTSGTEPSYGQRLQMQILFKEPVDFSQKADFMALMQANAQAGEAQRPTTGIGNMNASSIGGEMTSTQRLQTR